MRRAAAMECFRIDSCNSCLSPPRDTAFIKIVSVAMKGRCSARFLRITSGFTTIRPAMFSRSTRHPSRARNASGTETRRLAESSSVRSSHCVAAVKAGSMDSVITCRARAQMRSALMGLRLYGIADEPICSASNGSSTSLRLARILRSCPIFETEAAVPARDACTA